MHLTVGNMVMVVNHRIFLLDIMCVQPQYLLVDSNVFWIFVVAMLVNANLPLIVTKQLVFFFPPKV